MGKGRTGRTDGWHMMEIDDVTQHEAEGLFSAAFWQACEREAALLLRGRAVVDE